MHFRDMSPETDSPQRTVLPPGTYIVVDGYSRPGGTTTYAYKDVYSSSSLNVDDLSVVKLASGESAKASVEVLVTGLARRAVSSLVSCRW
jgi:hypothetical protein